MDAPNDIYEYKNMFNYSVWTPNTTVTLCNVPWDGAYRDVVRFDDTVARNAYFADRAADGYAFNLTGLVYLRYGEPVRINAPFDMVTRCNYLIVHNPIQPVPPYDDTRQPDTFYYFISDATYLAPNTTQINIQLDAWMTYYDRIHFDMCYVNKGHIAIANENSTLDNLTEYMTDTEGLNIGDEYEVVTQEYINLAPPTVDGQPLVMFMSSADIESDWGTLENPNLKTAKGNSGGGVPGGCSVYVATTTNFLNLMIKLSDAPWVSQCISYITIVPAKLVNYNKEKPLKIPGTTGDEQVFYKLTDDPITPFDIPVTDIYTKFGIPERYKNLLKFFTTPYTSIEMTYQNGGEIVLKPECITCDDPNTMYLQVQSATVPPDVRAIVFPKHYNKATSQGDLTVASWTGIKPKQDVVLDGGEGLDMGLWLTNFPQLSITNNMYNLYMASTAHSRAYQFYNADWSQLKANTAAQLAFNQATAGVENTQANQNVANQLAWAQTGIAQEQNLWSGAQSMLGGAASAIGSAARLDAGGAIGGLANMAMSGVNTALNANWTNRSTAANINAANRTMFNNTGLQKYNRDTNYEYARFAAKGDYESTIQAIQAKTQDARLTQPTTSGQNGGDMFNIANGYFGVLVKWKRLKGNFLRQVGDFWLRYGCYVNRWITPPEDLKCCENFTYWKMQSVALSTTEVPEVFKEAIRGIFEKGVTVWNDPNKIYKVDLADNEPVKGVRY